MSLAHRPIVLLLGGKKNDNGKLGDLPAGSGGGDRVYGRGVDICGMNIHHLHTHGHEHGFVRLYVGHCRIAMVLISGNFCRKIERDSLQYVRRVSFLLPCSFFSSWYNGKVGCHDSCWPVCSTERRNNSIIHLLWRISLHGQLRPLWRA